MRRIVWVVTVALIVLAVVAGAIALLWPVLGRSIWSQVHTYRWWIPLLVAAAVLVLLGWLFITFLRQPTGSTWRNNVLTAARALEHEFDLLPVERTSAERDLRRSTSRALHEHLEAARTAATLTEPLPGFGYQFIDWWTGNSVEAAYLNLHAAETILAQAIPDDELQARIPETLARLQTMEVTDPRRRAAETELIQSPPGPQRRAAFRNAVRIGLELKDQQHDRVRAFRNIVLTATVGLMFLVVVLCLVGAVKPDALPLCFGPPPTTVAPGQPAAPTPGPAGTACPSEEAPPSPGTRQRRLPAPGDVSLVALVGLLGGGLSAAVAIRHLHGSTTPYDIPVTLSLLKLPSGALSAIVGLLLIRGEFVPGLSQLDNQPQILAYAFLFGIAQHLVTRLVDRQAQDILGKLPSKEPMSARPEPPPTERPTQALERPRKPRRPFTLRRKQPAEPNE
jgi:hypothetical protein